ncbi:unnamed protein product [Bursaphelenchus xylophilus]|uniref:(pine wood nematode) hypothetical protein n=1 Tax=Bursaphelenchus xylophilus TaxID=6326 RepID=A0A811K817_BURXY|nr:unnamed protein product [Bursaphelenchus xylophilus]CAG9088741.1 unnamed protein product [Bursaphelenchus xylophilus]
MRLLHHHEHNCPPINVFVMVICEPTNFDPKLDFKWLHPYSSSLLNFIPLSFSTIFIYKPSSDQWTSLEHISCPATSNTPITTQDGTPKRSKFKTSDLNIMKCTS